MGYIKKLRRERSKRSWGITDVCFVTNEKGKNPA
jgi:hypothetical protein